MIDKIKGLLIKYKSIILYGIFGVLTTILNIGAYALCYNVLNIANVPSVLIAWVVGVIFAFFTNKVWVFGSKSFESKLFFRELFMFFVARAVTGVLDIVIMYVCVDVFAWDAVLCKTGSNILVIILNYVFSKLIVFKKK